jgi:tetratricopeptide (TPR) repeat protein
MSSGNMQSALELLSGSMERENATVEERLLHGRVLLRLGRGGDALDLAQTIVNRHPHDARSRAFFAQVLLDLGSAVEAESQLSVTLAASPSLAWLHVLHAQSALMSGNPQAALRSIERAIALKLDDEVNLRRAILLAANGDISQAEDIRRGIEDGTKGLLALYRDWIFQLVRNNRPALAMTLSENACVLAPAQVEPWLWRAELLLADARDIEALAMLQNCTRANEPMSGDVALRYARTRGRALRLSHGHDAAIAAFEQGLAERPNDQSTLRDLYVLNHQTGRDEKMRDYGRKLSTVVAKKLPPNLAKELANLRGRKPPPSFMDTRAEWAWELADRSVWVREAWLEALYWGRNADNLLRDWWLGAFDRVSEIEALIDPIPNSPLKALPEGTPCLCVTTHMGPLAASVVYLQRCGRPYRGFGYAGPDPVVDGEPPMRIAARGNSALRELMVEIRKGTLIGFAAESPETHQPLVFDFLGRKISVATFVPRLIWKLRIRSMWWHALWRDGRAPVEMQCLPDPLENEPLDDWCRRWVHAYLERVERVMRGNPENLNLGHGIWRNVD